MRLITNVCTLLVQLIILAGCTNMAPVAQNTVSTPTLPVAEPTSLPRLSPSTSLANTTQSCPVTMPNRQTPPGEQPNALQHGNGALWTELWPQGKVVIPPSDVRPDGSLPMKFGWFRGPGVVGKLTIEGHRLDGSAPPLKASIPEGYGETGFQSTAIYFSSEGCWEVTGRAGNASLTFVTLVVKAPARK